jgi:hypothetical protein
MERGTNAKQSSSEAESLRVDPSFTLRVTKQRGVGPGHAGLEAGRWLGESFTWSERGARDRSNGRHHARGQITLASVSRHNEQSLPERGGIAS